MNKLTKTPEESTEASDRVANRAAGRRPGGYLRAAGVDGIVPVVVVAPTAEHLHDQRPDGTLPQPAAAIPSRIQQWPRREDHVATLHQQYGHHRSPDHRRRRRCHIYQTTIELLVRRWDAFEMVVGRETGCVPFIVSSGMFNSQKVWQVTESILRLVLLSFWSPADQAQARTRRADLYAVLSARSGSISIHKFENPSIKAMRHGRTLHTTIVLRTCVRLTFAIYVVFLTGVCEYVNYSTIRSSWTCLAFGSNRPS